MDSPDNGLSHVDLEAKGEGHEGANPLDFIFLTVNALGSRPLWSLSLALAC